MLSTLSIALRPYRLPAPIQHAQRAFSSSSRPPVDLRETVNKPLNQARTINPKVYYDPAFFKQVQKSLIPNNWNFVGFSSEFPARSVTERTIGNQSLIITSDETQQRHAFFNTCRHRGMPLLKPDESRHNTRKLSCPYHQWTYDTKGALRGIPHKDSFSCEKSEFPLLPVPQIASHSGQVFVSFNPDLPEPSSWFGNLEDQLQPYDLSNWSVKHKAHYTVQANWLLLMENFLDYLHVPFIHPKYASLSPIENHFPFDNQQGHYLGFYTQPVPMPERPELLHLWGLAHSNNHYQLAHYLFNMDTDPHKKPLLESLLPQEKQAYFRLMAALDPIKQRHAPHQVGLDAMTTSQDIKAILHQETDLLTALDKRFDNGLLDLQKVSTLTPKEATRALFIATYPNHFFFLFPNHLLSVTLTPISPTETRETLRLLVADELKMHPFFEQKCQTSWDFLVRVNDEDIDACTQLQRGVSNGHYQGGIYSSYEAQCQRFHQLVAADLQSTT